MGRERRHRRDLVEGAEREAGRRGCTQIFVRSFSCRAPRFYEGPGYVEYARGEDLPSVGHADIHYRKDL